MEDERDIPLTIHWHLAAPDRLPPRWRIDDVAYRGRSLFDRCRNHARTDDLVALDKASADHQRPLAGDEDGVPPGWVMLRALIRQSGHPARVDVVHSNGYKNIDAAAVETTLKGYDYTVSRNHRAGQPIVALQTFLFHPSGTPNAP